MDANWIATVALTAWPLVALLLYSCLPVVEATIWTILGGYMLLPDQTMIKFAMIPAFDKISIPNLCAFIGCVSIARRPKFSFGIPEVLLLMYLIGPVITSELNNDPIYIKGRVLPGVDSYDGFSALESQFIFILPFFIGRYYLRTFSQNEAILRALVMAGLIYSLPMLFEIRMSPQLSNWIYGYYTSFATEYRYGGFRPVVFMGNGLIAAFFLMTSMVAAATLWRTESRFLPILPIPPVGITGYLGFVLVLCKSAGALVYGAALVMLVRFTKSRLQIRVALFFAFLGLAYPILRIEGLFPNKILVDVASSFNQDRADSLEFRFVQEGNLLAHASERFFFGWGRYGRNRVYTEESGKDDSITDGRWIVTMGQFGFVGFVAEFGLLTYSVFRAFLAFRFAQNVRERIFFSAFALIVAINIIDLLPNASLSPWTWLLTGALLGRAEMLQAIAHKRMPRKLTWPQPRAVLNKQPGP
jgi:hypothetical protein